MVQETYSRALNYAALKHTGQSLRGTALPYLVHVVGVAMEVSEAARVTAPFDLEFAEQVALLHDILEDTKTPYSEMEDHFGNEVAVAVLALTKFENLPKDDRIPDSLNRIKMLKKEVWAVKLADRITNLGAPPVDWDYKRRLKYLDDSLLIFRELKEGNAYLAFRLECKITDYQQFVVTGDK